MSDNGTRMATEGHPVVIQYDCYSGVMAHITPLNIPTLKAIQLKARTRFPYPDPRPYQVEEENAFIPGTLSKAEDNPQYVADCKAVDRERALWVDRTIFDWAVSFPQFKTRDEMVAWFRPKLNALREIAELPTDDYEAVLFHLVLVWNQPGLNAKKELTVEASEYNRLIQLAIQGVSLTPAEVTDGIRFFRPDV